MARTSEVIKRADKLMDDIIKQISKENNIPERTVRETLNYTYSFINNKIREGNLEGIRITSLGSFAVKPFKRKMFERKKEINTENGSSINN